MSNPTDTQMRANQAFMDALHEYVDARIDDADRANRRDSDYNPKRYDAATTLSDALDAYVQASVVAILWKAAQ